MKATLLLKKEHETLSMLLDRMEKPARGNDKVAHLEELRREMEMHRRLEEELFYPELINTPSTRATDLVDSALQRHDAIDKGLRDMTQHFSPKKFETEFSELATIIREYLKFEDEEIFAEAREHLSEFRNEQLGLDIEVRKRLLTTTAA
jgi:iron-sulfur cluster repair protein YtfE (RIC family)